MTSKNSLSIRLTEPVIFLRGCGDASSSSRRRPPAGPPAMLRGLLTLKLSKPTKIKSVEVELEGKAKTEWPEDIGIGTRRIEVSEEHDILSASTVFFRASSSPTSTRRALSVGPGLSIDSEVVEDEETSLEEGDAPPSRPRGRTHHRRVSADYISLQRNVVSHTPAPPYTPEPLDSPLPNESRTSLEAGQTSSDVRNTLHVELGGAPSRFSIPPMIRQNSDVPSDASSSSVRSTNSRRHSMPAQPPPSLAGPSSEVRRPGIRRISNASGPPKSPSASLPQVDEAPERTRNSRFSFSNVIQEVKERVVGPTRAAEPKEQGKERAPSPEGKRGRSRVRDRKSTFGKLSEVLGLELEEGAVDGDGWKEFRKGTYTYPISFAIPCNSPPTLHCDFGSVTYRLKAYVHRPGAFTSKMTAAAEVILISCPGEDDTEESENIVVEREWDTQLRYLISLSGKSFPIGGTMPLSLTLMPLSKMKVHRISAILEEHIDYYAHFKRVARHDPVRRFELLSIKHPQKNVPLLPIMSDSNDAALASPLAPYVDASNADDVATHLLNPEGPYMLHHNLEVPKTWLHFTNKHARSNISIGHVIKIILRVERGDDKFVDLRTGKRKQFDIIIESPVHILSSRCSSKWTSLPAYELFAPERTSVQEAVVPVASSSVQATPVLPSPDLHLEDILHIPFHSDGPSRSPVRASTSSVYPSVETLVGRSHQFARLISGEENEDGEAPPAYAMANSPGQGAVTMVTVGGSS